MHIITHHACKNGSPVDFKHYNDHTFRSPNIQGILDMLKGKPHAKLWNTMHNASMHMMIKWDEHELRRNICPEMEPGVFAKLTPKEVGAHLGLEAWFKTLDTPDLEHRKDMEESLF